MEAKVWPPMRFVCGKGGSCEMGMGCMSWSTCEYWLSPCLYPASSIPSISPPISTPSSRIFRSLIIRRCFRCRSRAAARTRSRRAISSSVISPCSTTDPCCCCCPWGCGACCCCPCWLPSALYARIPTAAFRSRSRLRRCLSAAFSRLILWLSVSPSRGRFRDVDPVDTCMSLSIQFFMIIPSVGCSSA